MADAKVPDRRLTSETKAATKTTEFRLTVAVIVLMLIAGYMIKSKGGNPDGFAARQVWLYVAIVVGAYAVSRGLAKSGVREYPEEAGQEGEGSSGSKGSSGSGGSSRSSGDDSSDDDDSSKDKDDS